MRLFYLSKYNISVLNPTTRVFCGQFVISGYYFYLNYDLYVLLKYSEKDTLCTFSRYPPRFWYVSIIYKVSVCLFV